MKTKSPNAARHTNRRALLLRTLPATLALFGAATLLPTGCASSETGSAKVVKTAASLSETIAKQAAQIEATSNALQKIFTAKGEEMVAARTAFFDALDTANDNAEDLAKIRKTWHENALKNLEEWQAHLSAIHDESMRKVSAANRATYATRFDATNRSLEDALGNQNEVLRLLEDSRKFFKDNLTIATVESVRGASIRTITLAAAASVALRRASGEIHDFAAVSTPGH